MTVDDSSVQLEERVLLDLIEDVLRSTPGLRYSLRTEQPSSDDEDKAPYAVFRIATNPVYDLQVSILLWRDRFGIRVNDEEFVHTIESRRRIDRWIERRCRDVDQIVKGDLKIETEVLFGWYLSSGLHAGSDDNWVEIADRDEGWGWIGLAAWLLPFGLSPLQSREVEYRNWFDAECASVVDA